MTVMFHHIRVINPNLNDLTPFPAETCRVRAAGSLLEVRVIEGTPERLDGSIAPLKVKILFNQS